MKMKILAFTLAMLLIASLTISCAEKDSNSQTADTTAQQLLDGDESTAETEAPYIFPDVDYEGHEFVILNTVETNWANVMIVPEELTGDVLNDAFYNRNAFVEEKLNIKISDVKLAQGQLKPTAQKLINAGDHVYDMMMQEIHDISASLTEGYFINLYEVPNLQLEEKWWDQIVIDGAEIMNELYFASSDISLFPFEATWMCYFNESLFDNYGIEYPYETVRQGKWTVDKMMECMKMGVSLNSESSFDYNAAGDSVYGIVTHGQFIQVLLCAADEMLIAKDTDGVPYFNGGTERFYSVINKIAALTAEGGYFISRDTYKLSNSEDSASTEFKLGNFLFLSETLGHINNLRDFEMEFGVLPAPKYDEKQESYQSMIATWGTLLITIPVTNPELERTGTILDLLAYQSYVSLMEPYYDTYLTQKGARNTESAEMLAIIRDTRTLNIGFMYGWTNDLLGALVTKLNKGNPDVASDIASREVKIGENIAKTLAAIES
jgi:hypothetical protein